MTFQTSRVKGKSDPLAILSNKSQASKHDWRRLDLPSVYPCDGSLRQDRRASLLTQTVYNKFYTFTLCCFLPSVFRLSTHTFRFFTMLILFQLTPRLRLCSLPYRLYLYWLKSFICFLGSNLAIFSCPFLLFLLWLPFALPKQKNNSLLVSALSKIIFVHYSKKSD